MKYGTGGTGNMALVHWQYGTGGTGGTGNMAPLIRLVKISYGKFYHEWQTSGDFGSLQTLTNDA